VATPYPQGEAVIVVPCYNEERRLDSAAFLDLATHPGVSLLFVDDGSHDHTGERLDEMASVSDDVQVLRLARNMGKGEAIRHGILHATEEQATLVGYLDADLATPTSEMLRLVDILRSRPELAVVMGSRIKRLGTAIQRRGLRHAIGRVYASVAVMALGIPVYDTQCGAKIFRVSPAFAAAMREPFPSAWGFDVRLLHRLLTGSATVPALSPESLFEAPLQMWHEVPGSKIRLRHGAAAFLDLFLIIAERRRARRGIHRGDHGS